VPCFHTVIWASGRAADWLELIDEMLALLTSVCNQVQMINKATKDGVAVVSYHNSVSSQ